MLFEARRKFPFDLDQPKDRNHGNRAKTHRSEGTFGAENSQESRSAMKKQNMMTRFRRFPLVWAVFLIAMPSCATSASPPLRRVSASEFMRPHTFKGVPTDQFIGATQSGFEHSQDRNPETAFKKIWEIGLFHSWAVLWCPADELPADYLRNAHAHPNRPKHRMESRRVHALGDSGQTP